jgi:hypothetical protein
MSLICYEPKTFSTAHLRIIDQAYQIIADYKDQGFTLTLRQLYYQFVARDLMENTQQAYKRLGGIVSAARLAGELPWDGIEDRTRWLRENTHWENPRSILEAARDSYGIDMWDNQPVRVEVWIEKDALIGVIEGVCTELDTPYFACRGYTSQSEIWGAAQRMLEHISHGQKIVVLHLGDHDPSGIDMTRDIYDRLHLFLEDEYDSLDVRRIALNRDQIDEYGPPPNPAKLSDSRAMNYVRRHGRESWELDALEPRMLEALVRAEVQRVMDPDLWDDATDRQEAERAVIAKAIEGAAEE